MGGFFPGSRHGAPLEPARQSAADLKKGINAETLQAVRQRQRDKQLEYEIQMRRAERDFNIAHDSGETERALLADTRRRQMSDAADALAQQITIIERVMEEFGISTNLEEEVRTDRTAFEQNGTLLKRSDAHSQIIVRDHFDQNYFSSLIPPSHLVHSNNVHCEEDGVVRDRDEYVWRTGV